jgi:anti-anti-sigma regulatory factor
MTDTLLRLSSHDADDTPQLVAQLTTQHKRCVIRLRGSLVQETLQTFSSMFDRLGRLSVDQVIVDLKAVAEMDEAGGKALLGLHHYVEARRAELIVWCADVSMATSVSTLGMRADMPLAAGR